MIQICLIQIIYPENLCVSKRHKSSASTMPNDEFVGYGKEPANGRSYLRKGMLLKDKSSLPTKRQRKQRGEHGVLIKHYILCYTSDTRDKKLKTVDSCSYSDKETLSSESD